MISPIFQEAQYHLSRPSRSTDPVDPVGCKIAINSVAEARQWQLALELLRMMSLAGVTPTHACLEVVSRSCRPKHWAAAVGTAGLLEMEEMQQTVAMELR